PGRAPFAGDWGGHRLVLLAVHKGRDGVTVLNRGDRDGLHVQLDCRCAHVVRADSATDLLAVSLSRLGVPMGDRQPALRPRTLSARAHRPAASRHGTFEPWNLRTRR